MPFTTTYSNTVTATSHIITSRPLSASCGTQSISYSCTKSFICSFSSVFLFDSVVFRSNSRVSFFRLSLNARC